MPAHRARVPLRGPAHRPAGRPPRRCCRAAAWSLPPSPRGGPRRIPFPRASSSRSRSAPRRRRSRRRRPATPSTGAERTERAPRRRGPSARWKPRAALPRPRRLLSKRFIITLNADSWGQARKDTEPAAKPGPVRSQPRPGDWRPAPGPGAPRTHARTSPAPPPASAGPPRPDVAGAHLLPPVGAPRLARTGPPGQTPPRGRVPDVRRWGFYPSLAKTVIFFPIKYFMTQRALMKGFLSLRGWRGGCGEVRGTPTPTPGCGSKR